MLHRLLRTRLALWALALLLYVPAAHAQATVSAATAQQQVGSVGTDAGPVAIENLVGGLDHPWGLAFLPNGDLLVTERAGQLRRFDIENDELSGPLDGTPTVFAQGQGGLLDVALHPDFEQNRYVYLSYAKPGPGGSAATALGRGRLEENHVRDFEEIFVQDTMIVGPNHFGSRIVFDGDGHVFLTMGERFQFGPAQNLSNYLGSVVRLNDDGSIPEDNPFVGRPDAEPGIWSYGHRNVESAALHPETGELWIAEMGPLGGDELNRPEAGRNYGWPVVSWGMNYDGTDIPDPPTHPELADAVRHWTPVISPSGMVYYTGAAFPEWQGSFLIGGLTENGLVRVRVEGEEVVEEERIPLDARIRAVDQGPDGMVYVLTDQDDGNVWRLVPLEEGGQ